MAGALGMRVAVSVALPLKAYSAAIRRREAPPTDRPHRPRSPWTASVMTYSSAWGPARTVPVTKSRAARYPRLLPNSTEVAADVERLAPIRQGENGPVRVGVPAQQAAGPRTHGRQAVPWPPLTVWKVRARYTVPSRSTIESTSRYHSTVGAQSRDGAVGQHVSRCNSAGPAAHAGLNHQPEGATVPVPSPPCIRPRPPSGTRPPACPFPCRTAPTRRCCSPTDRNAPAM